MKQQDLERQKETKIEQLRQEQNQERTKIETELTLKIRGVQDMVQAVGGAAAADPAAAGGGGRVLHPPRPRTRGRGPVAIAVNRKAVTMATPLAASQPMTTVYCRLTTDNR